MVELRVGGQDCGCDAAAQAMAGGLVGMVSDQVERRARGRGFRNADTCSWICSFSWPAISNERSRSLCIIAADTMLSEPQNSHRTKM